MNRTIVLRSLTAGVVVCLALGSVLGPSAAAEVPGLRFVGVLPDEVEHLTDSHGALWLDAVHRRAYVYYKGVDDQTQLPYVEFRPYDLDTFVGGRLRALDPIRVSAQDFSAAAGDRFRADVDEQGWDPNITIDPDGGRLFYSAGGAIYEVNGATGAFQKWVALPNAGGVPDETVFVQSGLGPVGLPAGLHFDDADGLKRLYQVGEIRSVPTRSDGVWVAGWDASPSSGEAGPVRRQLWLYESRTCINLARQLTQTQTAVFRSGEWLYTFCDASADGSSRGVLRIHLSPSVVPGAPPGELAPDGQEEFFPGVVGFQIASFADPAAERLSIITTIPGGGRNALVFDGNAGGGRGMYIGQVALSPPQAQSPTVSAGLDPRTGRWYFDAPEGLWYQDGRLERVAQGIRFARDTSGNAFGPSTWRPLRVDHLHDPPRVFVQRDGYYAIYEDTSPLPSAPLPPTERTTGEPESESTIGVYSGVTSASGLRARFVRGLSTLWPNWAGISIEQAPPSERTSAGYYLTDPFFYHAGDCGAKTREITFGRVLGTELAGGLTDRSAAAVALAVDPEVHHKSSPDETLTRENVENPDPCAYQFFDAMTGAQGPGHPDSDLAGMPWPYETVQCLGDASHQHDGAPGGSAPAASGRSDVRCGATADVPTVVAEATTSISPQAGNGVVSVQSARTFTTMTREPGNGLTSESVAELRGISIAGTVHLDEMDLRAVAHAGGRPGTATQEFVRRFAGLRVGEQDVCPGLCEEATVLEEIGKALGAYGYVRVVDAEADYTLGTEQGTLSVVQKNLLQQDADRTMNGDESAEWPGLEIGIYRDAQLRGGGRWTFQLGGVFAQAQFGVIDALSSATQSGGTFGSIGTEVVIVTGDTITGPSVSGASLVPRDTSGGGAGVLEAIGRTVGSVVRQVRESIGFAFDNPGGALTLAFFWVLLCLPGYIALRRKTLNDTLR